MIGIIHVGSIQNSPYLNKYINILEELNEKYEVVFWDRSNQYTEYPSNYLCFQKKSNYNKKPIMKTIDFIEFFKWVNKIIKDKKYDKLIVVLTLSGIFLANTLLKKYPNKYIFDIRDFSYENYKLFYCLEKKIIQKSFFTCISSEGFKEFLMPDFPYVISHNFNYNDFGYTSNFEKKDKGSKINVVWNGVIRYFDHQSQIIDKLKNDNRFNLIYHGSGPEIELFKNYCKENSVTNVTFTGEYNNSEKYKILADADILNNSYGIKNQNKIKYAIANKYYDGLFFGIPQLVEVDSFKHKLVEEKEIGIALDIKEKNFGDKLYDYYLNINEVVFNEIKQKEINRIVEEDKIYLNKIKEFILDKS